MSYDYEKSVEYQYAFENDKITIDSKLTLPPVAISHKEYKIKDMIIPYPIVTYGNFAVVQGPPKTFKTWLMSLFSKAWFNMDDVGQLKGHRKEIDSMFHFDTEQSPFHCKLVWNRVYSKLKHKKLFEGRSLRPYDPEFALGFLEYCLQQSPNCRFVILDGIADLVYDENDLKFCKKVVAELIRICSKYNVAMIVVIHTNRAGTGATGHLGSSLQKKAETVMQLKKWQDGSIEVSCKDSRNKPFPRFVFKVEQGKLKVINDNPLDGI